MGQNGRKTLIYALVARGTPPVTLAEYTEFSGNFNSIAYQCLQKLPSSNNKFTYNCDNHTFNYLVHDGFTYCVVAEESAGRQLPMAFLERIKDDFVAKYGGGKAATAPANGLNKEFGPKLKEHMLYCIEHPEEISKFAKVKAQVSEVKGVMMENIEKVLDRGEKIELLVDKTENLHNQAQDFRSTGTQRPVYSAVPRSIRVIVSDKMAVVASAPGKVLMTGGYLVLERPNVGIVLSTNARFYAIVKPLYEESKPNSWAWAWTDVKLSSPQMGREIMYKLSLKNLQLQCVSSSDTRNPFVEYVLQYVIAAARAIFDESKKEELQKLLLLGLDITILGCNEFYSYRNQIEARGLPLTPESLASLPPFTSISFNEEESSGQKSKPEVAKTGLGSSAAMTTAVVAALLHYLGVVNLPSEFSGPLEGDKVSADLDVVHIIAQTAHCIAQGKIGSGFDVSSAVYGSHRYVRFSPEVLSSAQDAGQDIEEAMGNVLKANWDHERTKFSLPPMMTLLLGEPGTGGSSTPSLVGAVKKWQKSDPQNSLETWKKLSEANSALEMHLKTLSKLAEINFDVYKSAITKCSILASEKWRDGAVEPNQIEVVQALLGARDAMLEIRRNMRKMGEASGVPIEPESQTQLLDTTMNMEGVLLAGVPGAGGFDAVFAVTLGESSSNVVRVWSSLNVLALLVREDPRGVSLESHDPRAAEITGAVSSMQIE